MTPETTTPPPDARPASMAQPARTAARGLIGILVLWFFVYLFAQGDDGYFARTADALETPWVKMVFLNLPLQIGLAVLALLCLRLRGRGAGRAALTLAAVDLGLMGGHVALSLVTG